MSYQIIKYCCSAIAISLLALDSFGQNLRADQLISALINSPRDSSRVELLLAISDALVNDYPNDAFTYANEGLKLSTELDNDFLTASSHNRIGKAYWSQGDLAKAFEELLVSIQMAEDLDNQKLRADNLTAIGIIHAGVNNNVLAIRYYQDALKELKTIDNNQQIVLITSGIGKAYLDIDQFDSADFYLAIAQSSITPELEYMQPLLLFNLAESKTKQDQFEEARSLLYESIELGKKYNDQRALVHSYETIAKIELSDGQIQDALSHSIIALEIAQAINSGELIHISYNTHSTALAAAGRFSEAYLFRDLSSIYQDSLINTFTQNQLDVFNYQQERSELALLRTELEFDQAQTQNQRYLIYGLSTVSLLAALLAYVFNQSRRQKAKDNISLELKNTEISAQRTELDELNKVKDKMLAIISHDFRTPLISLQNVIVMVEEKMITADELEKAIPAISAEMQGAKNLLENLLNWARSHMHGDFVKPSRLQLRQLVDEQIDGFKKQLIDKSIKITNGVDQKLEAMADANLISLVIRNLIGNSIKFCEMNGEIEITAKKENKNVVCCVSDDGVGVPQEKLKNLFTTATASSQGTSGEKGSGIGLTLCRDFVDLNGGRIWAESEEGNGSKFFFSIPGTENIKLEEAETVEAEDIQ